MVKKNKTIEKLKSQLGEEIAKCRGNDRSQRNLANAVGLPPSNMKYIEDGVNAPSGEIYEKLIKELQPPPNCRKKMDSLYTAIRKVPPPDVCKVLNTNQELFDVMRIISGQTFTKEQIKKTKELFKSFALDNNKGEINNAE